MPNQKLENLLNLSLEATPEERDRSQELSTGYNPVENTWEVIVKYSGSLDVVRKLGVQVEEMENEYAILTLPESLIDEVSNLPQIEYVEKPKRLFFVLDRTKAASCVNLLQESVPNLTGRGMFVAVLDSGIDYWHEDFRNEDGSTRIAVLWDQVLGEIYTAEDINRALESGKADAGNDGIGSRSAGRQIVPSVDTSGHGTAVAGIAVGGGRENAAYRGIAYEAELIVVKLGTARPDGFPRTTELMRGVNFVVKYAVEAGRPLAINISFGNTYGSHDGTSLLETFLDDIGNYGRTTIVVGSGNEGAAGGHVSGNLREMKSGSMESAGQQSISQSFISQGLHRIELSVAPYETGLSVQLWKSYVDIFSIRLQTPSGEVLGPLSEQLGPLRFQYGTMQILVYYGKPAPFTQAQEIYFDFIPSEGSYVESGIWTFLLDGQNLVDGRYDFWLPSTSILNSATRFLRPTPDTTLTLPSAAAKVITVGAYNSAYNSYADFSGRGYTRMTNQIKPDLAAPGVGIMAPAVGGGYRSVTGTSFATPVVTGSVALMMQWGILDGNDTFLYGEKVKAYLHRGAKRMPGVEAYPNPEVGYGVLCVRDSLPL